VDAQNQVGNNALIIAAEKGDLPIVQYLVEEGGALTDLENDVSSSIYCMSADLFTFGLTCRKGILHYPKRP
jgi:ankyrin repeat protein